MQEKQVVHIGCDHRAYELKRTLIRHLENSGYEVVDLGCANGKTSVDYPDYAHPVTTAVRLDPNSVGILLCHTANGMAMTANKYPDIRAAICWSPEIAKFAREHNDANVMCIPAGTVEDIESLVIAQTFLTTEFEGGRHQRRVEKIKQI